MSRVNLAQLISAAARDPKVIARFEAKVARIGGMQCHWWTGAIVRSGHGRFWINGDTVVIAHRFAWAITTGGIAGVDVLEHTCDEALCVNAEHLMVSDSRGNQDAWMIRRRSQSSPLSDSRGRHGRAVAIREAVRNSVGAHDRLEIVRAACASGLPLALFDEPLPVVMPPRRAHADLLEKEFEDTPLFDWGNTCTE